MRTRVIALCLLTLLLGTAAFAQSDRASVTGIVRDTSGAVVQGVQVTALNIGTGLRTTAETNELGFYTITNLVIGCNTNFETANAITLNETDYFRAYTRT